jgi:hypothetical protein
MRFTLLLLAATLASQQPLRNIGACTPAIGGTSYAFYPSVAVPLFTWQVTTVWTTELICKPAADASCEWCFEQQMWWWNDAIGDWSHGGVGELWDQFGHPTLDCGNSVVRNSSQYWGNQGVGGTEIQMRTWIRRGRCIDGGDILDQDTNAYTLR